MKRHTPGPWAIRNDAEFCGSKDFPWMVVTTAPCGPCDPNVVASRCNEVNAQLIAAAPELLCQLKEIVRCIRDFQLGDYSPLMDEIFDSEEAIRQAEGEGE